MEHIERTHPEAEILGVGLRTSTWIREWKGRNIGYRDFVQGHILFKLPQDLLCQMRYFAVEQDGGVTARAIHLGLYKRVRFQDCDRR